MILPKAKRNLTLLGIDLLHSAGLVLDVKNACWYFWDNPTHKYPFSEELNTPSIAEKMSSNTCQLREGESESLTSVQKEKLNPLLESFRNIFEPGGEATTVLERYINTGNGPPISVPPYRISLVKEIASLDILGVSPGVYPTSALSPCNNDRVKPFIPLPKQRGHPPKVLQIPGFLSGCRQNQRERM
ncbi:retrovirus-related Pol polyprotein from transposon 17.6 [Trichonephila inaurata madagascariensis]|uniref:Retrovirus-related Pol polyprotein from transposon 17.6 n=1 Tax=Trichonephila inaurata madagascariensis TaxID=2747483 RepID=A0A8X6Y816_9ARAC|nr:retrovirus-related Pol polyprotein from transposon 17.6 [Trichonephila inaurata madagascariensis]